ncbi:MAG: hypothetical protein HFG83_02515 [Dorea sp.]|nr:hypothetical protein [Dorea sp.]
MELEVKKRRAQLYRYQAAGFFICILGAVYVFYMVFGIDSYVMAWRFGSVISVLVTASVCIVYALIEAIACLIIRLGSVKIAEILATECDPFLYEACIRRNSMVLYKDRILCNIALAQHSQGNYDRAWETLQGINPRKLKGIFRANYYILLSDQYFKRGMGMQVHELEQAFLRSISRQTQYQQEYERMNGTAAVTDARLRRKRDWKYFEMLCAGNNLTRAIENQDYQSASRFLHERIDLNGNAVRPWMKVNYALKEAQIYLGLGENESAKLSLNYVVSKGNRMWCVQEAQRILAGMGTEEEKAEKAEGNDDTSDS